MSDEDWRTALREKGYRLTPQRELILRAVDELGHATPDEVLAHVQQQASTVNASTVYRTLEVLEELGLVRHAHLSDRAPTYHSTRGHEHFHLVCRGCREVISVGAEEAAPFVESLTTRHAFTPDLGHLAVFGQCGECASREADNRRPPVVEEAGDDRRPPVVEEAGDDPRPPVVEEAGHGRHETYEEKT